VPQNWEERGQKLLEHQWLFLAVLASWIVLSYEVSLHTPLVFH
jgi:hypothetical protein